MTGEQRPMRVWKDDPAAADLLGFGMVTDVVVDLVTDERLDPITVGVFSQWGGGKSTILGHVEAALKAKGPDEICVIRVNPWQYDDFSDVRERLITQILTELPKEGPGAADKLLALLKRVQWSRVLRAAGLAAAAGTVDLSTIIQAVGLKQAEGQSEPTDMDGFRKEFAEYIEAQKQVKRVVVLVDDLDRCLPDAAVAVLEAVKLFLSVDKISFVLAVDNSMIQSSIEASIQASHRAGFADRYLDKIVQVPIALPQLSKSDAIAYVALLMMESDLSPDDFQAVMTDVESRRNRGLGQALDHAFPQVQNSNVLPIARALVDGLDAERAASPRAIKRFLNAWAVRERFAQARGITLAPEVSLKLLLLEQRYPVDFEVLVGTPTSQRQALLGDWEAWARGEDLPPPTETATADKASKGKATLKKVQKPGPISEASRTWAAAEPALASEASIDEYLTLAASFVGTAVGGSLTDDEVEALQDVLDVSDAVKRGAVARVKGWDQDKSGRVVTALVERAAMEQEPSSMIHALVLLAADEVPGSADAAVKVVESVKKRLTTADAVRVALSKQAQLQELAARLSEDPEVDGKVRSSFKQTDFGTR